MDTPTPARSVGAVKPQTATFSEPLQLRCGLSIARYELVYETYGELNADRSNAILVCHALNASHHVAGFYADDPDNVGWWDNIIGPGKPVDTDRLFVVCANLLGGCMGTTGPASPNPETGDPYGLRFPLFTVGDLVNVHRALLRHLGIRRLLAAVGGSLGGMQALQWSIEHPDEVHSAVVVCSTARLSAQNIAFSAVAREAIMRDPNFHGGDYQRHGVRPDAGLSVARMMAHITYLSEEGMRRKFGRRLQDRESPRFGFDVDFQVESYLHHQGEAFLKRFDANSYLYLTRVMDYFDPFGDMVAAGAKLERVDTRFLVMSFDSDWRFDTAHSRDLVRILAAHRVPVTFREIASPHGHDSFLLEVPEYHRTVASFMRRMEAEAIGGVPGDGPGRV